MTKPSADPRAKFLVVAFISSIGVISTNIALLCTVFLLGILFGIYFEVTLGRLVKKFRKVLYVLLIIIVIQSLFISDGITLIELWGIRLITDIGLHRGLAYLLRVTIILLSGAIISTSNTGDTLHGFVKLGVPYEFAFTASIGIRFLPILLTEINSTYIAIQLRGVNIKKLKIGKRIEMVSYLFLPTIYGAIVKAKKISESVEKRGFRIGGKRTWYRDLLFSKNDYILSMVSIAVFAFVIYVFSVKGDLYESLFSSWLYQIR